MSTFAKLKALDFYRRIPRDLTEASLSGAGLSLIAAVTMVLLFIMEMGSYLSISTTTNVIVDQSLNGDLLRINFNFSFPSLSCEFASVDVTDVLGTSRMNITKTVKKYPINHDLEVVGPEHHPDPLPTPSKAGDEHGAIVHAEILDEALMQNENIGSLVLTSDNFDTYIHQYNILIVNFHAPWCPWCQRLDPAWEEAATIISKKYHPEHDGRIQLAKIDCTVYVDICRENHVQGFPSIRIFRRGHNTIETHGGHDHESYYGDRDTDSLVHFAESLVPAAVIGRRDKEDKHAHLRRRAPSSGGCHIAGFVLVKKVPGNLLVSAHSVVHSFDPSTMNMSHVIHSFQFGRVLPKKKQKQVERLLPHVPEIKDRIENHVFVSKHNNVTHDHFVQVVKSEIVPYSYYKSHSQSSGKSGNGNKPPSAFSNNPHSLILYEYTVHSSSFQTLEVPVSRFHYEFSPMQVLITELRRPFFHFLTNLCAIIGGVFTVAGILDGAFHGAVSILKKVELGKQF